MEIADVTPATTIDVEWGNDIRDRTVQRYPSVAGRTSEHPTPAAGDLAFLEDSGAIEVYFGGSWRGLLPSGAVIPFAGAAAPTGYLLCNGAEVSRSTYAALYAAIGEVYGAGNGTTTFNLPDLRQRLPLGKAASGVGSTLGGTGGSIDHTHAGASHSHTNPWTSLYPNHQHTMTAGMNTVGSHGHTNPSVAANGSHDHAAGNTGGPSSTLQVVSGTGVNMATSTHTHDAPTVSSNGSHAHTQPDTGDAGDHAHTLNISDGAGSHQHTIADTGAGGTGATGTGNPPFLALNYIIKT